MASATRDEAAQLAEAGQVRLEQPVRRLDIPSVETTLKYEGYLRRQESEVTKRSREENRPIPRAFPYSVVPGLSAEVVQRLSQMQPETLGQAMRCPGVTPAAIAVLSTYVSRYVNRERVTFREKLARRAKKAGFPVRTDVIAGLRRISTILRKWNRKVSLTSLPVDNLATKRSIGCSSSRSGGDRPFPIGAKTSST